MNVQFNSDNVFGNFFIAFNDGKFYLTFIKYDHDLPEIDNSREIEIFTTSRQLMDRVHKLQEK